MLLTIALCVIILTSGIFTFPLMTANADINLTLGVGSVYTISIPAGDALVVTLNLLDNDSMVQKVKYWFTTTSFNTKIQLYKDNVLITETMFFVTFTPEINSSYKIRVSSINGNALNNLNINFYPDSKVYMYSYLTTSYPYTDYGNHITSAKPLVNMAGSYVSHSHGYYGTMANMANNKYYMLVCPGVQNGTLKISDDNNQVLPSELPNMYNTDIAVFSVEYGGLANNAAYTAVYSKDAGFSLSWPGKLNMNRTKYFTTAFWHNIALGSSPVVAMEAAKASTISNYWYIIFWGSDTVRTPNFYVNPNKSSVLANNEIINVLEIKGNELLSERAADNLLNSDSYYIMNNEYDNIIRYVKTLNGHLTNDYIIYDKLSNQYYQSAYRISLEDECYTLSKSCKEYTIYDIMPDNIKFYEEVAETYYLKDTKGMQKIIRSQVIIYSGKDFTQLHDIYYNANTGEVYSEIYINKLFNT